MNNLMTCLALLILSLLTACKASTTRDDRLGAYVKGDSIFFALEAPGKTSVCLLGDVTGWKPCPMSQNGSRWEASFPKPAGEGVRYQYCADGMTIIADPYSQMVLLGDQQDKALPAELLEQLPPYPDGKTSGAVSWLPTHDKDYQWKNSHVWIEEDRAVFYEILVRDFSPQGTFEGVREHVDYLRQLGVSAVELMPVNEFGGNDSWGYNPEFLFAVDKAYGSPDDLRLLVDSLHGAGISVVLDIVLNHAWFTSPLVMLYANADSSPAADNPWFNPKHNFENPDAQWGADFNHESPLTQALADSVLDYWVTQFRFDGVRLDFTKGFSNTFHAANGHDAWGNAYDERRIEILRRLFAEARRRNPEMTLICEHLADEAEERALAETGFLLWADTNWGWCQSLMGWRDGTDVSSTDYQKRGLHKPSLVGFIESHDQERAVHKCLAWGNRMPDGSYDTRLLPTALMRARSAAMLLMSLPGPKMIWQFGELGYDTGINYVEGRYAEGGRTARKPDGWALLSNPDRRSLLQTYAKMIDLHTNDPLFATDDYEAHLAELSKHIILYTKDGRCAIAAANFDVFRQPLRINLREGGSFRDIFTGRSFKLCQGNNELLLEAGEGIVAIKE